LKKTTLSIGTIPIGFAGQHANAQRIFVCTLHLFASLGSVHKLIAAIVVEHIAIDRDATLA
jgi:hypothetical protein